MKFQAHTKLALIERNRAVALTHRDVDLAARQEAGRLAADGHDVGLGQHPHQRILGLRINAQQGAGRALLTAAGRQRVLAGAHIQAQATPEVNSAGHAQLAGGRLAQQQRAATEQTRENACAFAGAGHPGQVYAQAIEHAFADFGNLDFEHHLLRRTDPQQVDHPPPLAQRQRQAHHLIGLEGIADLSGQYQGAVKRAHLDRALARQQFSQLELQKIGIDRHVQIAHKAAPIGRLHHQIHGARPATEQKHLGRAEQHDIHLSHTIGLRRALQRRLWQANRIGRATRSGRAVVTVGSAYSSAADHHAHNR